MGKKENIEELFKDAFESFEAPVDPSVWAGVQSGLGAGAGAGAGSAAGAGITSKIVGFTIAAAVVTGVTIGVYNYTSSDEPQQEKTTPQEQIIEDVSVPGEEEESLLTHDDNSVKSTKDTQKEEVSESVESTEERSTENEESSPESGTGTERAALPVQDPSDKEDSNRDLTADNSSGDAVANNKIQDNTEEPDAFSNTAGDTPTSTTGEDMEDTPEPLSLIVNIENSKGNAPLTVNMSGQTNGSQIIWTIHEGNQKKTLEGTEQLYTFENSGKYLVTAESSNDSGEKNKQEFLVEVEPDQKVVLDVNPDMLDREGAVILRPGSFDQGELDITFENEDQVDFFRMVVIDATTQKVVFETTSIDHRNWNGTNQAGEPLPAGQNYYLTVFAGDKDGNTVEPIRKRLTIIR